jgi:NADPH2 dehydrogenase
MRIENPIPQFSDVIRKIKPFKIAYLYLVKSRIAGSSDIEASDKLNFAYDI